MFMPSYNLPIFLRQTLEVTQVYHVNVLSFPVLNCNCPISSCYLQNKNLSFRFGMLKHTVTRIRDMGAICSVIQACIVLHNIAQKRGDLIAFDLEEENEGNDNFGLPAGNAFTVDGRTKRQMLVDNYFTLQT